MFLELTVRRALRTKNIRYPAGPNIKVTGRQGITIQKLSFCCRAVRQIQAPTKRSKARKWIHPAMTAFGFENSKATAEKLP
jgi:hypothetical protein